MIFQSLCGFLPFLDAISDSVTNLHSSIAFEGPSNVNGLTDDNGEAKSIRVIEDDSYDALGWQLWWTLDLLDTSHVHVDLLVLPCAYHTAHTASVGSKRKSQRSSHTKQKQRTGAIFRSRSRSRRGSSGGSLRRLVAAHEEYLTYAVVVATLQVFLHLTHANVTTLFLPMLAQATGRSGSVAQMVGDVVLAVVTTCGVVGSALARRQLGKEAMCAISGVLVVLCQVAVPATVAALAGAGLSLSGGGGGARMMTAGGRHAAAETFALACAVSGGFGWAWAALFWSVPGPGELQGGIRSVGQAAGAVLGFGLGFAQLQCFLLTLRQLKHGAFAYYAVWIWS